MKSILGLIFLTVCSYSGAGAGNRIDCLDVMEGEELGGKFVTTVAFDSSVPSFSGGREITITGQPPKNAFFSYLSANSACGVNVDFAKDCKVRERMGKLGYSFDFKCGN